VLARHAENLYWAGRYLERAELTARSVDVTYHALLESPPTESREVWRDIVDVLQLGATYTARHDEVEASRVVGFLVSDADNPGSVLSSITRARDNLRGVRELVSSETWESINSLYLQIRGRDLPADLAGQPYELFGDVRRGAQLVVGVANETMPHDDGWRFLTLGRMLERVELTCRLLLVRLVPERGAREMIGFQDGLAILRSVSASEAFRRTHRRMDPAGVVEFLLLSQEFPRAVLYCLRSAELQLSVLGEGVPGVGRSRRMLGRLRASVEYRNVDELVEEGLARFLDELQDGTREVATCVGTEFFRQGQPATLHTVTTS
jgi:uncharacterized alpha-E superfamily protein